MKKIPRGLSPENKSKIINKVAIENEKLPVYCIESWIKDEVVRSCNGYYFGTNYEYVVTQDRNEALEYIRSRPKNKWGMIIVRRHVVRYERSDGFFMPGEIVNRGLRKRN